MVSQRWRKGDVIREISYSMPQSRYLITTDKQPSYKHFSAVGAFSLKFSIALSGETTDRIKKS